jgi:hypothetical protein
LVHTEGFHIFTPRSIYGLCLAFTIP